jgi:tetratricopeptide (TPR) repeat protein
MKKLLYLLLFVSYSSYSQDYGNNADALKLCSALQTNNFGTDVEAENALDKILNVIGASKRFVLQPCDNINNAVATSYKGIRYILYDKDFLNSLNYGNNWGNLFILAHEVGHHINGHSLDLVLYISETVEAKTLEQRRQQEIEADEFAGFVLAKLGGPLSSAEQSISSISSNKDDTYSTHPSKGKRFAAVKRGFNKGNYKIESTKEGLAEEYFIKGLYEGDKGNIEEALNNYTMSISLDPKLTSALNNRSIIYMDKGLYKKALEDINIAIKLKRDDDQYFSNRARIKMLMSESADDPSILEAIGDLTTAISLNPKKSYNYLERGMCKYRSLGWETACKDFLTAQTLGEELPSVILSSLNEYGCE